MAVVAEGDRQRVYLPTDGVKWRVRRPRQRRPGRLMSSFLPQALLDFASASYGMK